LFPDTLCCRYLMLPIPFVPDTFCDDTLCYDTFCADTFRDDTFCTRILCIAAHGKRDFSKTEISIKQIVFSTVPLNFFTFYYSMRLGTFSGFFSHWLGSQYLRTYSISYWLLLYTAKKYYEIPGLFLTKPSRDSDWVHYSRPGRVW